MTINPATAPRRLLLLLLTPLLLPIHWWSASAARSASSFFTPERTTRHHVQRRLVRSSSSVEDAAVKCASSIAIPSLRGGYDEGFLGGGGASNVRTMTSLAQIRAVIEDAASSSSSSSDGGDDDQVLVVLDFASRNCPPCEMIKPVYDGLSVSIEFVDRRVVFCAVNVSDHPDVAEYYGVDGWPTFLFFRGGVEVDRMVGGRAAKEGLYGLISKHSS